MICIVEGSKETKSRRRSCEGLAADRRSRRSFDPSKPSTLRLLKQVAQTQLHVASRAVLARDASERGAGRVRARVVQVRMVQEIEHFRPELHRVAAAHRD